MLVGNPTKGDVTLVVVISKCFQDSRFAKRGSPPLSRRPPATCVELEIPELTIVMRM